MLVVIGIVVGLAAGAVIGGLVLRARQLSRLAGAERTKELILADAERRAEAIAREAQIDAREQTIKLRATLEEEIQQRRAQVLKAEERILSREEEIEGKIVELGRREQGMSDRETHLKQLQDELKQAKVREIAEVERISGMTVGEAKQHLLERSEDLVRHELARRVRQLEEEARAEAKRRARNLVADALQRVAASHAAETTVSVIELPSDDMKGRI